VSVPVADTHLRHVWIGRDDAEPTTKTCVGAIALYLVWCALTCLDWHTAAATAVVVADRAISQIGT
jgi:hypothetical protein